MIRRLVSSLALVWVLGFLWFAIWLPQPVGDVRTDGVVALTGAGGRIERGIAVLDRHLAPRLLVSGVDREVRPREFAAEYGIDPELLRCCITLGYESVDTRSNAREAARWIARYRIRSVRLVTSDWHMRRAAFDLAQVAPAGVTVVEDAVRTRPSFYALFLEYHKLLARMLQRAWGD
ncbi:YdcF family protein [Novosphingobium piscinae]|uniref:YdcF family protein n=1 Tax=Novosphingobium piscinae TaxID=1507448 RepID=A0A7X1FZ20_9SPHN|nr:YdcF family protein [Novosphingobium piscinae]MBC2669037.1 YdcF family protein [Novosphingobium piscinae]